MAEQNEKAEAVVAENETAVVDAAPPEELLDKRPAQSVQVIWLMGLVMFALLLLLASFAFREKGAASGGGDGDLAALKADLEVRRNELNRQRTALGMAPISGSAESLEEITARLERDASTLVAMSRSFEEVLGEKDRELNAKSEEVLALEKQRQTLMAELSHARGELQKALAEGSGAERLAIELEQSRAQREALVQDLNLAKQRLAEYAGGLGGEDVDDLRRQLEEVSRAKDFFEKQARELSED